MARDDPKLRGAEHRATVVRLRRQGLTFRAIADEMGLSHPTVIEHYYRALKELPAADVAAHRAEMAEQLDEAAQAVLAVLRDPGPLVSASGKIVLEADEGRRLDAARTLTTVQARLSALLGADADKKVSVDGELRHEIVGIPLDALGTPATDTTGGPT